MHDTKCWGILGAEQGMISVSAHHVLLYLHFHVGVRITAARWPQGAQLSQHGTL